MRIVLQRHAFFFVLAIGLCLGCARDDPQEVAKLRAEVERLRQQIDAPSEKPVEPEDAKPKAEVEKPRQQLDVSDEKPVEAEGANTSNDAGDPDIVQPQAGEDEGSDSETSRAVPGTVIENSIGMKLAPIPAGEFMMGYSGGDRHRVEITKPSYLGVYEVTQAEFERVMGDNPANFQHDGFRDRGGVLLGLDTSRFPVEGVGWASCREFCERLSQLADERAAGRKYRLPTEAEWEYACRAGTDTPYCCGDMLDADSANFKGVHPESGSGPRADRTATVGSYKPNAWGLYDMHGNVREWCQDWYSETYYATSATDNPQGPSWGSSKVLRGGYFCGGEDSCRSGCRDESSPTTTYCHDGFRVLCELVGQNETTPASCQVTAIFTVHEGDEDGPTFAGAEVDLLHRPNSEAEGVALGHATSDAQGIARVTLSVSPEQQSKGEFFVVLKSPDPAEPKTLPGFPRSLKWNLYLPRRLSLRNPAGLKTVTNSIGMYLVLIRAGEFQMGFPDSFDTFEFGCQSAKPQHPVRITKPFFFGATEVTQEQYEQVMGRNPSGHTGDPQRPVERVSWRDAMEFCRLLGEKEGKEYRLPTEAEWEYACRAGTTTTFYCAGADLVHYEWIGYGETHPVAQKKPNPWGLYDMHGNVEEWCADWCDKSYYAESPKDDPTGPSGGSERVHRGGCYALIPQYCASAWRSMDYASETDDSLGFRLVLTPPMRREVTAIFTVRDGDEFGPTVEGALVELLHRADSEAEGVVLGRATSDGQGIAKLTAWISADQQMKGEFIAVVKSPGPGEPRTLPGFPRALKWNVYSPRRSSAIPRTLTTSTGMKLVLVPPGEFQMGFPESYDGPGCEEAQPQHPVRITKPFYLAATEVTQEQYERLVGKNPSGHTGDPQLPVENVSWEDAVEFCRLLSEKEGKKYRLPTEAEWEHACRAGSKTLWCCPPNKLADYAWYSSFSNPQPVAKKKPNAWGLYDMHGNVREWCADWFGESYYAESPKDDPTGPTSGSKRVHRGGCYANLADSITSALRWSDYESETDDVLGFRVALTADQPAP